MKQILALLIFFMLLAIGAKAANADAHKIDKLRKFYKEHNLDFFDDLIAEQENLLDDEKRHAKLELLADDARTKALNQLEMLLRTAKGDMVAELLLRKATLLSDRARTATYFQNNPFKASKLKAPNFYLKASIDVFQEVERRFGNHPRMDVVTFSIAYNYGELRDQERSYQYYNRLVNKYAESPLVGDARLAIAEIEFDRRKFPACLAQLKEIVKMDHPRLKNFALYKMAWTYYNMADLDSGMLSLEKVIDGVNAATGVQRAKLELRKEALHDLVAFYAEKPDNASASNAAAYFERVAHTPDAIASEYASARQKRLERYKTNNTPVPDEDRDEMQLTESQELLFRLVQVYRDQGKHENAMTVAEQLIDKLERHPKVVALYRLRAESAEKLRRRDRVLAELERFAKVIERDLPAIDDYSKGLPETTTSELAQALGDGKPPVVTRPVVPKAATTEKLSLYQQQLLKLGFEAFNDFSTFLHGEWSKTQSNETARQAVAVYDLGVRAMLLPSWRGQALEPSYELLRRRAQLHFALKHWELAASDFRWLAQHLVQPEAEIVESHKGEIASLEALLKQNPVKPAPGELHPLHQRLLAAYDGYLSGFLGSKPQREPVAGVLATSAHLLREYGKTDAALARLMYYSREFSDQREAVAVTRDIMALLNGGSRWEELRDFTEGLLSKKTYKGNAVEKEIAKSNEYASLRLLETLEKNKDWSKAAKEFAAFAKKNPESSFVSQALIKSANAALESSKESKDVEAAVVRLEEATHAPDAAVQLQAWLGLEPFYRRAFQWKKLITLYENVLKLKADAKATAAARENLAAIRALGDEPFAADGAKLLSTDPDLGKLESSLARFEASTSEFRKLRFVKSNNNPARNFKKKADMHAALAARVDKEAEAAPQSLKGVAALWANIMKAELLLEFAETMETAALPAALSAGTEADKKSYIETIMGQARELRGTAQKFVVDSAQTFPKVDCPLSLETRLNALLEKAGEANRLSRPPVAELWKSRPGRVFDAGKADDEEVSKLGLKILSTTNTDDLRKLEYRLAESYLGGGSRGYAYAIFAALRDGGKSDEWAHKAAADQFRIDAARLPAPLAQAAESDHLSPEQRWNLARWLAGRGPSLDEEQSAWAQKMLSTLLRAELGSADRVVAHSAD